MFQSKQAHDPENPGKENIYEILVKGNLIPLWEEWFEGFSATTLDNDEILLSGPVADQSELHGLLAKLRDLNMELVRVNRRNQDAHLNFHPSKPQNDIERRKKMNNQKGLAAVVGVFVGLAVAGISMTIASQVVPGDFARTVMIAMGSAIFGAALTFFLIRMNNLFDK